MFTNFHLVGLRQDESNLSNNEQQHSEMISVLLPLATGATTKYVKIQQIFVKPYGSKRVSGLNISQVII